jgi:quercetin dioxygenase-like cupin family protein
MPHLEDAMTPCIRLASAALLTLTACCGETPASKGPEPKVISLDAKGASYFPILVGPPGTMTMRSGIVTLTPGKSVGRHTTAGNEEILVVLEGRGEFRITGGPTLPVLGGSALYCPPNREHDVFNTGEGVLRYVFVVAKALP